jgi:precorrin-8X/cobalt-precorrin-8 methylmutase
VTGPEIHPIEAESYAIMARRVDLSRWEAGARDVVARLVHATADESFASSARIGSQAITAAIAALHAGASVICDTAMVAVGASMAARLTSVRCYLERVPVAPAGGTRAASALALAGAAHPAGAVWVIGTAPTALVALLDLCRTGRVEPAAVVGLPVGYVGAADAKAALWNSALRDVAITNCGPRGGSAAAAAAINALARLAATSPPAPAAVAPTSGPAVG